MMQVEVISHQALSFFEEKRYTFQERRNWSSGCNGKWRRRSKKAAKYITKSNIESGVAYTIRELLKRQGLEDPSGIAAESTALYLPNNVLREILAEIKYLIF